VLGGILLDPDAIGRVADVLQPEAFYLGAHREIYRTALMLHSQGKPTDLTAMAAWLADTSQLEKVGGSARLMELVDRTLSTASIDQVARLVMDKYLRRRLIRSGNEVIQLGFDQGKPMEQVLDEAEQKIFAISQEKPSQGLTPTAEILTRTFEEIETRSLGTALAGLPVNFYDLDAMTQGLQRSDLLLHRLDRCQHRRPELRKRLQHLVVAPGDFRRRRRVLWRWSWILHPRPWRGLGFGWRWRLISNSCWWNLFSCK
jgi:replicative DNA helicase